MHNKFARIKRSGLCRRFSGQEPWLWFIVLIALLMTAWLSLARFNAFTLRAFDLGTISQAIWSASQGKPLLFTTEGYTLSRLARHVELFYFFIAPVYALVPSPRTLLVIQAGLYAAGAFPVYHLALRRLQQRWAALALAATYLFYPVALTAVLFDFHGDTLAMPLLLFALDALDRQAWRWYAFWLALALACKFYVAVPVAALGVMLWLQGKRPVGGLTAAAALGWGMLAFLVIRPLFAPPETAALLEATASSYLNYYFGQLNLADTAVIRLANVVIVSATSLLLIWRAPGWLLPVAAVVLPVAFSSGPGPSYDYRYHHYALAVPFLLAGMIYGAAAFRQEAIVSGRPDTFWQRRLALACLLTMVLTTFLVNMPLNPRFLTAKPGSGLGLEVLAGYKVTGRDRFKEAWLASLPLAEVPLAADRLLASRLTNREVLYLMPPEDSSYAELLPRAQYVVLDGLFDQALAGADGRITEGGLAHSHGTVRQLLAQAEWRLLAMADGLLLFGREGDGLQQGLELIPLAELPPLVARFGDNIGLVQAAVTPVNSRTYRLQLEWVALHSGEPLPLLVAVSRLEGVENGRILHLPTLGLLPTSGWPANHIIRETIEFTLPPQLANGRYPLSVGWYDPANIWAAESDGRSRVGESWQIGWLEVE
jgi:uncharacterized membrane protein